MEKRTFREVSQAGRSYEPTLDALIETVRKIAADQARAPLDNEAAIIAFLKSWWSRTYNRPLKDPILLSYTLPELLYEFWDRIEREKAATESAEQEGDKIEEAKEKEVLDWAEREEQKELEELAKKGADQHKADPTKDPENIKWMQDQLEAQKKIFGDDFGEDVNFSLDE